ncbi:MAG: hypothetical protein Ct9H300mP8_09610 [Gammaproteobacteria bacterium]|nr:MAG: hypothetical protein Ct9H300mP8_09610 [Gammaproteobacteria bacterium]
MSLTERVRKANMLLVLCRVLISTCLAGFSCASDDYPWLTDLDSGPGVKASRASTHESKSWPASFGADHGSREKTTHRRTWIWQ